MSVTPRLPSPPRSMKLRSSGAVDWGSVQQQQAAEGNGRLPSGVEYLRRTTTPRKNRPPTGSAADPLRTGPVQYESPTRPAAVTFQRDETARPATAGAPAPTKGDKASAALYVSELDFHLGRVVELLRRSDRAPFPEAVSRKIRQVAAFDTLTRTNGVD
jgi:hypothetical protein